MKSEAESDKSDGWTDIAAAAPSALSASPSPTDGSGWSEAAANGATPILTEQASESGDELDEWGDLVGVFKSAADDAADDVEAPPPEHGAAESTQSTDGLDALPMRNKKRGRKSRGEELLTRAVRARVAAGVPPEGEVLVRRPATPLLERPAVEISDAVLLRLRQGFEPGQSHPLMHAVAAAIGRAVDDLGAVDQETL